MTSVFHIISMNSFVKYNLCVLYLTCLNYNIWREWTACSKYFVICQQYISFQSENKTLNEEYKIPFWKCIACLIIVIACPTRAIKFISLHQISDVFSVMINILNCLKQYIKTLYMYIYHSTTYYLNELLLVTKSNIKI